MHLQYCVVLQPPTLPTSKNYPEMRERLRLRLKKKVVKVLRADFHKSAKIASVFHNFSVFFFIYCNGSHVICVSVTISIDVLFLQLLWNALIDFFQTFAASTSVKTG